MINYHTTTRVWLSLEYYYNQGITPEEAKEVIENHTDLHGNYLHCESMGINGNWIIEVPTKDTTIIAELVYYLSDALDRQLQKHGKEYKQKPNPFVRDN